MAPLRRELYIYYRVVPERIEAARVAVVQMQAALTTAFPGLRARLLLGSNDAAGVPTWMETYARAPKGVDAALQQSIEAHAAVLAAFIVGSRHLELFAATD